MINIQFPISIPGTREKQAVLDGLKAGLIGGIADSAFQETGCWDASIGSSSFKVLIGEGTEINIPHNLIGQIKSEKRRNPYLVVYSVSTGELNLLGIIDGHALIDSGHLEKGSSILAGRKIKSECIPDIKVDSAVPGCIST